MNGGAPSYRSLSCCNAKVIDGATDVLHRTVTDEVENCSYA